MTPADDQTLEGLLDAHLAGEPGAAACLCEWGEAYFRAAVRPALVRQFGGLVGGDTSARYTRVVNDLFERTLEGKEDAVWRQRSAAALRAAVTRALANDVRDVLRRRRGVGAEGHELEALAEERRAYFEERFEGLQYERALEVFNHWLGSDDTEHQRMARVLHQRYLVGERYDAIAESEGIEDRKELYRLRDRGLDLLRHKVGEAR